MSSLEIHFEKKHAEVMVDAIQTKIDTLAKLVDSCLKAKQTDAAGKINVDIKALMAVKDAIEKQAGIGGDGDQ